MIVPLVSTVKLDQSLSLVTVMLDTSVLAVKQSRTLLVFFQWLTTIILSLVHALLVTIVNADQVSLKSALLVLTKTN